VLCNESTGKSIALSNWAMCSRVEGAGVGGVGAVKVEAVFSWLGVGAMFAALQGAGPAATGGHVRHVGWGAVLVMLCGEGAGGSSALELAHCSVE
jgi:hypothetical protein